jgi:hypothetical protein
MLETCSKKPDWRRICFALGSVGRFPRTFVFGREEEEMVAARAAMASGVISVTSVRSSEI